MRRAHWIVSLLAAFALAACTPPADNAAAPEPEPETSAETETPEAALSLPEVSQADREALASNFLAVEPSELGVFAAPSIDEALAGLLGPESVEGGEALHLSVSESGEIAVADVVRTGIPDDSVGAGHVRIEFQRSPEGWYPINAYRRWRCHRGAAPGQWTTQLCP